MPDDSADAASSDLQASTAADPAADAKAEGPPSDAAATSDATAAAPVAKEFTCLRCSYSWDRHATSPTTAEYRPRACPSCHSAYWQTAPKLQHARRPSAMPGVDHAARQAITRESRQRGRLSRILYAMEPAVALAAVRAHPPIAALLAGEPSVAPSAAEPQRVIIEVHQPPAPIYPWQTTHDLPRADSGTVTMALIPPPPSVATLPQFTYHTLGEPSPEQVVARREP